MLHFNPNNGMQQIYTIQGQQSMPTQAQYSNPNGYPPHHTQPNGYPTYAASQPNQSNGYTPTPINHYAPTLHRATAPPPGHIHTSQGIPPRHHQQASINGLPPGFNFTSSGYATSPVDNYSMYNGSVYGNNSSIKQAIGTPHAPPPSIASGVGQHTPSNAAAAAAGHTQLNYYQQLMANRNAVK